MSAAPVPSVNVPIVDERGVLTVAWATYIEGLQKQIEELTQLINAGGLPSGGVPGEILTKASNEEGDATWT